MQHSRSKTQPVVPVVGRGGGSCCTRGDCRGRVMIQDILDALAEARCSFRQPWTGAIELAQNKVERRWLEVVERPGFGLSDLP